MRLFTIIVTGLLLLLLASCVWIEHGNGGPIPIDNARRHMRSIGFGNAVILRFDDLALTQRPHLLAMEVHNDDDPRIKGLQVMVEEGSSLHSTVHRDDKGVPERYLLPPGRHHWGFAFPAHVHAGIQNRRDPGIIYHGEIWLIHNPLAIGELKRQANEVGGGGKSLVFVPDDKLPRVSRYPGLLPMSAVPEGIERIPVWLERWAQGRYKLHVDRHKAPVHISLERRD